MKTFGLHLKGEVRVCHVSKCGKASKQSEQLLVSVNY